MTETKYKCVHGTAWTPCRFGCNDGLPPLTHRSDIAGLSVAEQAPQPQQGTGGDRREPHIEVHHFIPREEPGTDEQLINDLRQQLADAKFEHEDAEKEVTALRQQLAAKQAALKAILAHAQTSPVVLRSRIIELANCGLDAAKEL